MSTLNCAERALQRAESLQRCMEIFAGSLGSFVAEPSRLVYVGVLTLDAQQPCLAHRTGDDRWIREFEPEIAPLCYNLVEGKDFSWILNGCDPVPHAQVKRFNSAGGVTFDFFLIGCHGIVILGALSPLERGLLSRPLRELATRMRQLDVSKRAVAAVRDQLSSVLTKHAYQEMTECVFTAAFRRRSPVSVAVLDLDNFKKLNTVLGYLDADKVIASLGRLIVDTVGDDLDEPVAVGRFGGDEFMFTFVADGEFARRRVVQRVQEGVPSLESRVSSEEARAKLREKLGGCSASVGIATWRFDGAVEAPVETIITKLVGMAEVALKKAKELKNRVVLYDSLTESERDANCGQYIIP